MVEDDSLHSINSDGTIRQRKDRKIDLADPSSRRKNQKTNHEVGVGDSDFYQQFSSPSTRDHSPAHPLSDTTSTQATPPTSFPTRTPARTKRRSVSSNLSQPSSPTADVYPAQLPPQDFSALLSTPAPLLFSTPLERSLLNNLSDLGFDIGQMVHSVLSDACDASGALWWMLKRKAEKRALEAAFKATKANESGDAETELDTEVENNINKPVPDSPAVEEVFRTIDQSRSAPELAFVPPTPTAPGIEHKRTSPPVTPPRSKSPRSLLSPTPTSVDSSKSSPSTPSQHSKEGKDGSKGRSSGKLRSGSVSIVQRATTAALEAAGLVRKKSSEAVLRDSDKDKDKDKERKEEKDKRPSSSSDTRNSHTPSRLTKSPPLKPVKDNTPTDPGTPEREVTAASNLPSSPWVIPVARSSTFHLAPTPANSPGNTMTNEGDMNMQKLPGGALRNRNSLLATFRTWFNEDRKGKRKAAPHMPGPNPNVVVPPGASATPARARGTFRRHVGVSAQKPRAKRASISSRRSSSVNSRRSSVASMQMIVLESPHHGMDNISRQRSDPSRRSFTPVSEAEREPHASRPSSIRSYSLQNLHRKSPSTGSNGSTARMGRAASPLQRYHRRAGSGSSTRVVRQTRPTSSQNLSTRPAHVRSNSTASSIHSLQSSRPGSFYDASEGEGQRTGSPLPHLIARQSPDGTPRRTAYNRVLVAHKKQTPFGAPSISSFTTSVSRSSWKKAWGMEPPGWRSRPSQFPVEVLAISSGSDMPTAIRDVFSGRQSINLGDDSEWVDEDDDQPTFVGGLGQVMSRNSINSVPDRSPIMLSPVPRNGGRSSRKAGKARANGRSRVMQPLNSGNMPLQANDGVFDGPTEMPDTRMSRRQLPSKAGMRIAAVQEEEEEEE